MSDQKARACLVSEGDNFILTTFSNLISIRIHSLTPTNSETVKSLTLSNKQKYKYISRLEKNKKDSRAPHYFQWPNYQWRHRCLQLCRLQDAQPTSSLHHHHHANNLQISESTGLSIRNVTVKLRTASSPLSHSPSLFRCEFRLFKAEKSTKSSGR